MSQDLYRHFDAKGNLLYVGISMSTIKRLAAHKYKSNWFSKIAKVTIEKFETRRAVEVAERFAVIDEKPKFNKQMFQGTDTKKNSRDLRIQAEQLRAYGLESFKKSSESGTKVFYAFEFFVLHTLLGDSTEVKYCAEADMEELRKGFKEEGFASLRSLYLEYDMWCKSYSIKPVHWWDAEYFMEELGL